MAAIARADLRQAIHRVVRASCTTISPDVSSLLRHAADHEQKPAARTMLAGMLANVEAAQTASKPVCQSPGFPTVYVSFGKAADLSGIRESFEEALVAATREGYLRPSIVHPLTRKNSGDNSGPGVPNFEYSFQPGKETLDLIISFKGCGAELGNALRILTPASLGKDLSGLKRFVLETVIDAGGKPCPPVGIGIGIGGQMDVAAKLSRRAISTRKWDDRNEDPLLNDLEAELLSLINQLGLGAAGIGGDTYALAVKVGMAATHTAICPVAVNFHCWVARRAGIRIRKEGSIESLFL